MNNVERVQDISFLKEYKMANNDYYQAEHYFASVDVEDVGEKAYNDC